MLVLLPLIGYDLGDPKTVSTSVGYLLQVSIACRITFCFIKVGTGLCRTCYVTSVTAVWSQQFDTADADNDGRIDRQEWIAHGGDDTGFDLCDSSEDDFESADPESRIDRQEWIDHFGNDLGFNAHDIGDDGTISREELLDDASVSPSPVYAIN